MRKHIVVTVLLLLAVSALVIAAGSASAAVRSCGKATATYPNHKTQVFAVKVTKGTIGCAAADKLISGAYLAPGVVSPIGPGATTSTEQLKSGWRCVFPVAPPGPLTCTKGKNKVHATPAP
jgi:hypothetical protein